MVSWKAFLQSGRRALARLGPELANRERHLKPDDLATIMYTSGTTGNPKGVMLTHGNLLSNAIASKEVAGRSSEAIMLSWLPYSHIYARTCDFYERLVAAGRGAIIASAGIAGTDDVRAVRAIGCAGAIIGRALYDGRLSIEAALRA